MFSCSHRARLSGLAPSPEDTFPCDLTVTVSPGGIRSMANGCWGWLRVCPVGALVSALPTSSRMLHGRDKLTPKNAFFTELCACSTALGTAPLSPSLPLHGPLMTNCLNAELSLVPLQRGQELGLQRDVPGGENAVGSLNGYEPDGSVPRRTRLGRCCSSSYHCANCDNDRFSLG